MMKQRTPWMILAVAVVFLSAATACTNDGPKDPKGSAYDGGSDTLGGPVKDSGGLQGTPSKLKCGEMATLAMIQAHYPGAKDYDPDATTCKWGYKPAGGGVGSGSLGGFTQGSTAYESMLSGAKQSLGASGTITEPNTLGKRSFEFVGNPFGLPTVELGFLTSNGKYAVVVSAGLLGQTPSMATLRALAKEIDQGLATK